MKALVIASTLTATITCSLLGSYTLTRESIQEKINGHCLLESASLEGWKLAEEELKKEISEESLISPFKDLYKKLKDNNYSNTGNDLKNSCVNLYSWDNSSIFKSEDQTLLQQTKKYCGLKIKIRLGDDKSFSNIVEDSIQNKITSLNSHTDSKGILTDKLKKIKESSESDKKQSFKEACEELYEKPFLTESSNEWKLVENYCKKE